jgi:hypothetical protein
MRRGGEMGILILTNEMGSRGRHAYKGIMRGPANGSVFSSSIKVFWTALYSFVSSTSDRKTRTKSKILEGWRRCSRVEEGCGCRTFHGRGCASQAPYRSRFRGKATHISPPRGTDTFTVALPIFSPVSQRCGCRSVNCSPFYVSVSRSVLLRANAT